MDHGKHFYNHIMYELTAKLGLFHESYAPYYPKVNGKVEATNKVLKIILLHMIWVHISNWHLILYVSLQTYRKKIRTTTRFTHFQLIYVLEEILPIECEISSLKLIVELLPDTSMKEERLLHLMRLYETRRDDRMDNEAYKKPIKAQYDKSVKPRVFLEGDLIFLYDQESNKLRLRKFDLMWLGPYIVKHVLAKGAYELVDFDGVPLVHPRNGLYLKKYYA